MLPHGLAALVELLLRTFWVLATAAVLVTLTPFPLPQVFKCVHAQAMHTMPNDA